MRVSVTWWNQLVDHWFASRLRSFTGIEDEGWPHPWHTSARWNEEAERWECSVKPGFVNGREVVVKSEIRNSKSEVEMKDVPLTDAPALPITSTRLITSGTPEYFVARGARDTASQNLDPESPDFGITEITGPPDELLPRRSLRACEIILSITRPRTVLDYAVQPDIIGQGVILSVRQARMPVAFRLRSSARALPPRAAAPADIFSVDNGLDEYRVATVFFLGPENAGEGELDQTWEPRVRHHLFWNADYETTAGAFKSPEPLRLTLAGLGAGAQINVNQLLAQNNDAYQQALAYLTSSAITGALTTPGHRTAPPYDTTASLDPPFPFVGASQ